MWSLLFTQTSTFHFKLEDLLQLCWCWISKILLGFLTLFIFTYSAIFSKSLQSCKSASIPTYCARESTVQVSLRCSISLLISILYYYWLEYSQVSVNAPCSFWWFCILIWKGVICSKSQVNESWEVDRGSHNGFLMARKYQECFVIGISSGPFIIDYSHSHAPLSCGSKRDGLGWVDPPWVQVGTFWAVSNMGWGSDCGCRSLTHQTSPIRRPWILSHMWVLCTVKLPCIEDFGRCSLSISMTIFIVIGAFVVLNWQYTRINRWVDPQEGYDLRPIFQIHLLTPLLFPHQDCGSSQSNLVSEHYCWVHWSRGLKPFLKRYLRFFYRLSTSCMKTDHLIDFQGSPITIEIFATATLLGRTAILKVLGFDQHHTRH